MSPTTQERRLFSCSPLCPLSSVFSFLVPKDGERSWLYVSLATSCGQVYVQARRLHYETVTVSTATDAQNERSVTPKVRRSASIHSVRCSPENRTDIDPNCTYARAEARLVSGSSQQTQMTGHILSDSSELDASWKRNVDETQHHTPSQITEHTHQSDPTVSSGPRYNFSGLLDSQSQSQSQGQGHTQADFDGSRSSSREKEAQRVDDDLSNSQKENAPTSTDESQPVISRSPPSPGSSSAHISPVQATKSSFAVNNSFSPPITTVKLPNKPDALPVPLNLSSMPPPSTKAPLVKGVAAFSVAKAKTVVQPPPRTPTRLKNSNTRRIQRSPSPLSQDSFAGTPPAPDRLYQQTHPLFQVPFSQLFQPEEMDDGGRRKEEDRSREQKHGAFWVFSSFCSSPSYSPQMVFLLRSPIPRHLPLALHATLTILSTQTMTTSLKNLIPCTHLLPHPLSLRT